MKHILYEDLYDLHFLSDINLAPDGRFASFSVHRADQEENRYHSELWLLNTADHRVFPLAARGEAKNVVWLNDTQLLFSSTRDEEKMAGDKAKNKEETRFYQISRTGGEAEPFMTIPAKGSLLAALDENRFLFLAVQQAGAAKAWDTEEASSEKNAAAAEAKEREDFFVFDELPFWFNGKGVVNKLRSTLALYNKETKKLIPLTPEYFQVQEYALSPNRTKLLYTGSEYGSAAASPSIAPRGCGLYVYDLSSGKTEALIAETDASVGNPAFFDEERIFYTRMTYEFVGRNPYYHIRTLSDGADWVLPFCDASVSNTVGSDAAYGGGLSLRSFQGSLYFTQTIWSHTRLVRLDADGTLTTLCDTSGSIRSFDLSEKGFYLNALRHHRPNELYFLPLNADAQSEEVCLTQFHDAYLDSHELCKPDYFIWKNRSGLELEGFVIKPSGFLPGHSYPGILEMHGGPKVVFGDVFHHEMQCLAHKGYFVFYTNPRGSDGRGEDFANITGQLGGIDYEDFLDFTDEVLARYPELNPEKIGICGGSYGGFMCNWMIGHTDRFAAAASQRSISNYFTKGLCTDIGFSHNMAQLDTTPWESFEQVWEHSPLKEAPKAKTPTLFIQSDEDYRCWMSDAIQMYSALKQNQTPARLVLFHGENHELSRSGKPENRMTRLREIGSWFDTWLKI